MHFCSMETFSSVNHKILSMQRDASLHKGKFTVEEKERIRQALENNEDFKRVAKELCKNSVQQDYGHEE